MSSRRLPVGWILAGIILAPTWCAASGPAFPSASGADIVQVAGPSRTPPQVPTAETAERSNDPIYIGLMGEFVRPGVHVVTGKRPTLSELVRQANGLSEEATGNIRIFRNDRACLTSFYTPDNSLPLEPNDILVADSKVRSRMAVFQPERTPDAQRSSSHETPETEQSLQIGLLNVLDRPIILKIRRENATLASLISLLGQSADVIPGVRIIQTAAHHRSSRVAGEVKLASNSVLVFSRGIVEADRMPPFPDVIVHDTPRTIAPEASHTAQPVPDEPAAPAAVGERKDGVADSDISQAKSRVFIPSPMPTQDQPSQATTANPVPKTGNPVLTGDSSPSISEEPQAEPILVTQSPVATEVAERPRFQSLAPPDIPHPYNSLGQTDTALEGREPISDGGDIASKQSVPFPMPGLARPPASGSASAGLPFAVAPDHHVAADTHDRILADTDSPAIARRPDVNRSAESTVPVGWHFMVVGMISLTAVLIAGSILWTMGSQAVAASRSRLLQPTSAVLDAVINKSIRVVEEPLAMPTEIQLHGQACRPTLVRVEDAHKAATPQTQFSTVVA